MHRSSRSHSVKNEKAENTASPISWAASSRQALCKAFYNIQRLQEQSDFAASFVLLSCVAASAAHLSPCISSTSCMDKLNEWLPAALTCYPALEWATEHGKMVLQKTFPSPKAARVSPHCSPGLSPLMHLQAWAQSVLMYHTSWARVQTYQTLESPEEPPQL